MSGALELTVVHANGTAVVRADGEIDMATEPDLTRCLEMVTGDVVFDLAAVTFLDSTGMGALVRAHNRLTATGGDLILRAPSGIVRDVLEIVGLGDWIETETQTDRAAQSAEFSS